MFSVNPYSPIQKYKATVLVADDVAAIRKTVHKMMTLFGCIQCDLVENGKQAVESVKKKTYDLIITDLEMPEMNGIEAARAIRKLEATVHTPILLYTASNPSESEKRTYRKVVDACLSKPALPKTLQRVCADLLEKNTTY